VLQLDASHHGLDLGCGNGLIAEYVSDRTGAHITGLDYAELRPQINFTAPALQALFGNSAFDARMQAEQLGKLAVSLAMIAPLLMLSYTRRDFFLIRGNLRAPIEPVPLLGLPKPDRGRNLVCNGPSTLQSLWPSCNTSA